VQRELFEKVGGFDPNYPLAAHEDQDLKLRLDSITTITFVPDAYIFHPVRLISFKEAISRMPKRSLAFAYHASKNRERLGYTNIIKLIYSQYKSHILCIRNNLKMLRFKTAITSLVMLLVGIPIIALNFNRQNPATIQNQGIL
jgi:GT2 family glycosyltransferase